MGITRVLLLNCHLFTVPPAPTSLTVGHLGSENENGNQELGEEGDCMMTENMQHQLCSLNSKGCFAVTNKMGTET